MAESNHDIEYKKALYQRKINTQQQQQELAKYSYIRDEDYIRYSSTLLTQIHKPKQITQTEYFELLRSLTDGFVEHHKEIETIDAELKALSAQRKAIVIREQELNEQRKKNPLFNLTEILKHGVTLAPGLIPVLDTET